MHNIEIFIRIAIIAACPYVSVLAAIDFYATMKQFSDMTPYPLTARDPTASGYRKAMWIAFSLHIVASTVAIFSAGKYAIHVWVISLLPLHAIPGLLLFVLSLSLLGILGGSIFVAANWVTMSTIGGALFGTAGLGFCMALFVEVDASDRETRRERARSEARFRG